MILALLLALLGAPRAEACTAVSDVRVHTPTGPEDGWDVVWSGDRIVAVGAGVAPADCARPYPDAVEVTAGFIAVGTATGLVEIELEPSTRDDAWDGDPVRAALQVGRAYNPHSSVVPVTRLGGITSAVIDPRGGLVSGQGAWVHLTTGRQSDAVLSGSTGVVVHLDGLGNRGAALVRLEELLDDAAHFASSGLGERYDGLSELSASRLDLAALVPVLRGQLPLVVHAERAVDLEALAALAQARDLELVVFGASEGWMVADLLAQRGIAVVIDPFVQGAGGFDQVHGRADNAALLHAAGVPIMIAVERGHNARSLRFVAGNAVREGLPHAAAVRALTLTPAAVFGQSDRGRLAPEAMADVAVWSGDPLDTTGRLIGLVLGGQDTPLTSRQTVLMEAWREVPRPLLPTP